MVTFNSWEYILLLISINNNNNIANTKKYNERRKKPQRNGIYIQNKAQPTTTTIKSNLI